VNVVAGLDVGGTKVTVRVETIRGERVADGRSASGDWSAIPAGAAASWLMERLRPFLPEGRDRGPRGRRSGLRCPGDSR
jgi:N-acetylglucosamine kinase-like BadF-type ATPase